MKAIDTNIVVRLLTGDDEVQLSAALALIEATPVLVTMSVAMESEWVLRSAYGWSRLRIADAFTAFIALENIAFAAPDHIDWIVERFRSGADFADMIHITSSIENEAFVTFDRKIAPAAGPDCPIPIETLA